MFKILILCKRNAAYVECENSPSGTYNLEERKINVIRKF
jgi:hypothetical protein